MFMSSDYSLRFVVPYNATSALSLSLFLGGLLLLLQSFRLEFLFTLGIGRWVGHDLEERVHSCLWFAVCCVGLEELVDLCLDTVRVEARFFDQKLGELFSLWFLPLEFDIGFDLVVVEEISSQNVGRGLLFFGLILSVFLFSLVVSLVFVLGGVIFWEPVFGNRVFGDILDNGKNFFDASMLTNQLETVIICFASCTA